MNLWRTKSLERIEEEANSGLIKLNRSLSGFSLLLLSIGAIIGAGLFSITGIAAAENAGPAVILSFLLASIGCAFAGLCFCELAGMIPIAGGAYSYTYASLGEFVAWMIGWVLILEYAMGASVVAISWSAYIVSFFQNFNIQLPAHLVSSPWQPVQLSDGTQEYGYVNLPALLIVCGISFLLIAGIKKSASVNTFLVAVKILIVLSFIALGMCYIDIDHFSPFIPENTGTFGSFGWSGILRGAGTVFFAYVGFDAISTAAQEVQNPQKSIPFGIMGSLFICTALYVLFSFVLVGLVPYQELNVAAPVAEAIKKTPYTYFHWLMHLAIITGLTSVILVMLLGQSRVFFTMSKDGLLPLCFSRVHPRFRTPWISNLIIMGVVGLFSAFAPLHLVGHMTSMGTLLAFIIVCISVMVLRKTKPEIKRPFKTPYVPVVPILGIITCAALMLSLSWTIWIQLVIWLSFGLLIYFLYGKDHSHLAN
jgi:basic amino acid/polyamine antiporter, APA family